MTACEQCGTECPDDVAAGACRTQDLEELERLGFY